MATPCTQVILKNKYYMQITISMQDQLWRTKEVPSPGYNVVEILDEIGAAKTAGELEWVDWDEPLRLDIQVVD